MATTRTAAARTPSIQAILDALRQRQGATTAELAETAGIGRSTAGKTLATLEAQGRANRQHGTAKSGRPAPDRWTLRTDADRGEPAPQPAAEPAAEALTAATSTAPSGSDATPATSTPNDSDEAEQATATTNRPGADADQPAGRATGTGQRLRSGALRGLVRGWLAERPGQSFSPTRIANELGRSAGAVGNALATMTQQGEVVQTSRKPRRYAIAKQGDHASATR
jgi:predicted Rossmann fold nucleotide-binding protein DprA/Smf involved in DNA uptake